MAPCLSIAAATWCALAMTILLFPVMLDGGPFSRLLMNRRFVASRRDAKARRLPYMDPLVLAVAFNWHNSQSALPRRV